MPSGREPGETPLRAGHLGAPVRAAPEAVSPGDVGSGVHAGLERRLGRLEASASRSELGRGPVGPLVRALNQERNTLSTFPPGVTIIWIKNCWVPIETKDELKVTILIIFLLPYPFRIF